ncbi:MAG: B12-binding domain-containing radical SAM protein, partial [Candidatus Hodarchaeota archaeon]
MASQSILFIYSEGLEYISTPKKPLKSSNIHYGISYISSFLQSQDYATDLLVLTRNTKKRIIATYIEELKPLLVCFTATTTEYYFISKIARYIKSQYPNQFLLIGGVHASVAPKQVIKDPFDALCIGEGEYPTLELVKQLEKGQRPSQIRNLWIKNGQKIEKNLNRPFIQDLDHLPFPDRDMWQKWVQSPNEWPFIILGKGCPFLCTYCCNHTLKNISSGKYVRLRSVENILRELGEFNDKFPHCSQIHLETESIGINLKFALELCSELEKFNAQ